MEMTYPSYTISRIGGLQPFKQLCDCKVCKARSLIERGKDVNISHRVHDIRRPESRKTRGLSARTVEVEKLAAFCVCKNSIFPIEVAGPTTRTSAAEKKEKIFTAVKSPNTDSSKLGEGIKATSVQTGDIPLSTWARTPT
jgi:hypothetical protein